MKCAVWMVETERYEVMKLEFVYSGTVWPYQVPGCLRVGWTWFIEAIRLGTVDANHSERRNAASSDHTVS